MGTTLPVGTRMRLVPMRTRSAMRDRATRPPATLSYLRSGCLAPTPSPMTGMTPRSIQLRAHFRPSPRRRPSIRTSRRLRAPFGASALASRDGTPSRTDRGSPSFPERRPSGTSWRTPLSTPSGPMRRRPSISMTTTSWTLRARSPATSRLVRASSLSSMAPASIAIAPSPLRQPSAPLRPHRFRATRLAATPTPTRLLATRPR